MLSSDKIRIKIQKVNGKVKFGITATDNYYAGFGLATAANFRKMQD